VSSCDSIDEMDTSLSPRRTIVTTFSSTSHGDTESYYDDGVYVLHVAASNETLLSCALSDKSIHVFDRETLGQRNIISKAHDAPITDLCHLGDSSVVSSGQDGFVKLFDLRMATPALELKLPDREQALSVSIGYGGTLTAIGSGKSKIHFYDLRTGTNHNRRIGCYVDAHTDEVTRVRFQAGFGSHESSLLVSASEDGLACVHDTSQSTEENALLSVMNIMSPIRQVGFFGPSGEGLFCLTGSETLSCWHHDSAQRIFDFGSIRERLTLQSGFTIDYLVNCFWDHNDMNLNLLAGNNSGDAAIFVVSANSTTLSKRLVDGHKSGIRATTSVPLNAPHQHNVLYTVGEDSRLCEWIIDEQQGEMSFSAPSAESSTIGPVRKSKTKQTHKPY